MCELRRLRRADLALYEAKAAGRNRLACAPLPAEDVCDDSQAQKSEAFAPGCPR